MISVHYWSCKKRGPATSARRLSVALAGLLAWPFGGFAAEPSSPATVLQSFALAESVLRAELVAAEPLIASPWAMAFDASGSLYVLEDRGFPATGSAALGKIALLHDTDGDGVMDRRTNFAGDLAFPSGILPWRGGVIVPCAPNVLFLKDTDGDGQADERRILLTGFAGLGSTLGRVNSPTLGPDGWIYFSSGLAGGMITAPEHPERKPVKVTGDLRWQPFTGEIENVAGGSSTGMSFDDFGRRFIGTPRGPIQQVVFASNWLERNPLLAFSETTQNCRLPLGAGDRRGGGDGFFPLRKSDRKNWVLNESAGPFIWRGMGLRDSYRGAVFSCEPEASLVHLERLLPRGGTFATESFFAGREFLASADASFQPVFLASGPDDALYIVDHARSSVAPATDHPGERPSALDFQGRNHCGRIWRITGAKAAPSSKSPAAVGLASPRAWTRALAFRNAIEAQDKGVLDGEWAAAETVSDASRAAGLHLLAAYDALDAEKLQTAWNAGEADLRALILRLWLTHPSARAWKPDPAVLGNEPEDMVRLSAALALGDIPEGVAALAEIAALDSGDRWTRAAVASSVGGKEDEFLAALWPLIEKPSPGLLELLVMIGHAAPSASPEKSPADEAVLHMACLLGETQRSHKTLVLGPKDSPQRALLERAVEEAGDVSLPNARRILAVCLLGHADWAFAEGPLRKALVEPAGAIRLAALRAIAGFTEPEILGLLLSKSQWAKSTPSEREITIATLLERPAHFPGLLAAVESGAIPASAFNPLQRALFDRHPDLALRARAAKVFERVPEDRQRAFTEAQGVLARTAHAEHGRAIFRQSCASCHRLDGEGYAVGPDLFSVRRQSKEVTLDRLMMPAERGSLGFTSVIAETKDGRILSGLPIGETATSLTLLGPLGTEQRLLRSNLRIVEHVPVSLMPGHFEQILSAQELADLLAYLHGEP